MRNQGILYIIMLACLLAGCGEKETVLRFHAATYNGFRPEVQIGQASWQATMDSVQGTGEVSLPVDHPVLATVQFGKYDKRTVYIEPGKVGIFLLNEDSYCKKLEVDRSRQEVRLISFNPDYEDRIIEECDDFRTIGLVLGWWPK